MTQTSERTLSIDFETASMADLKRTGARLYSQHPSTRVLCMAYAFDDDPVQLWYEGQPFPSDVAVHVNIGGMVRAWNASFELSIWNNTLTRWVGGSIGPLSPAQVRDTMAQAAYWGLPLSLDMAGPAAGLRIVKDKAGHALMLRMCRPRAIQPDGTPIWWHETDPEKWTALGAYCMQDVEVERGLARVLPPLPARELALWQLDYRMNTHGVGVDLDFVGKLKALAVAASGVVNQTMARITGGFVRTINQTKPLLELLQSLGYPHDDLRKGTVTARLDDPACAGMERELLELRADGAKTSAAKLDAMIGATDTETSRVAGMLQHYGASRTGRWAGRLVQLQNMPQGHLSEDDNSLDTAIATVQSDAPLGIVELLFGSPLKVVSSLLRSCLVAPKGKKLVVADSSQIEARVLPWLAGQEDILDVFRNKGDVYKQAASGIFRVLVEAVSKAQRQIGKVAVLALGFGGGKGAFKTMAANFGLDVSDEEAEKIKVAWREANDQTVRFWYELEAACKTVIRNPGRGPVPVGKFIRVGMWGAHLIIVLPSDRALVYREARLLADDDGREGITYMGMNQYTRKWERIRTYGGKLAENVTQATARDVLAETMLILDRTRPNLTLTLTVHDELVGEADDDKAEGELEAMLATMRETPSWAPGLPVDAAGWVSARYKK